MIEVTAKVTVDLKPLRRFASEIEKDLTQNGNGEVAKALSKWAVRMRGFLQKRFASLSRGGGEWPPLSPRTIAGRRKGSSSILRDTGTLFAALNPVFDGRAGAIEQRIKYGVRVGYGSPAKHPKSQSMTISQIAEIHQLGLGRNPVRRIIVPPDQATLDAMVKDMELAVSRI